MQKVSGKRELHQNGERSQTPLWFAIVGLLIIMASRVMQDEMIGDVVVWVGAVFTVISLIYYFARPRHGF